jgi:hypothetical protein
VSLLGFQQALADMVGSPKLARAVRAGSDDLRAYDLTPKERARLEAVAAQRGMEVNCTLYRTNRLTPVVLLLPYTCFLLGDRMKWVAERFWGDRKTDLQFRGEIERFAAFLRELLESGELDEPLLAEVLTFELATNDLRFAPRRQIGTPIGSDGDGHVILHPLVRLVRFRHDPARLLQLLSDMAPLPYQLPEGDFPVALVAGADELEVRRIDPQLASLLEGLRNGSTIDPHDAELLVDAGLAVPAA